MTAVCSVVSSEVDVRLVAVELLEPLAAQAPEIPVIDVGVFLTTSLANIRYTGGCQVAEWALVPARARLTNLQSTRVRSWRRCWLLLLLL